MPKVQIEEKLIDTLNKAEPNIGDTLSKFEANIHSFNYLKMEEDGMISYIKDSSFEKVKAKHPYSDPFKTKTRQKTKLSKVLNHYFPTYRTRNQKAFDSYRANLSNAIESNNIEIKILRGDDIPIAFNRDGDIDLSKFDTSCANYKPHMNKEAWLETFNIYTKNDIFGCVTFWEDDKIIARTMFVEGENLETIGDFKKGETYKVSNRIYAKSDVFTKMLMKKWLEENNFITYHLYRIFKYEDKLYDGDNSAGGEYNNVVLPLNNTKYQFCPVDSWHCNIKNKTFNMLRDGKRETLSMYNLNAKNL